MHLGLDKHTYTKNIFSHKFNSNQKMSSPIIHPIDEIYFAEAVKRRVEQLKDKKARQDVIDAQLFEQDVKEFKNQLEERILINDDKKGLSHDWNDISEDRYDFKVLLEASRRMNERLETIEGMDYRIEVCQASSDGWLRNQARFVPMPLKRIKTEEDEESNHDDEDEHA